MQKTIPKIGLRIGEMTLAWTGQLYDHGLRLAFRLRGPGRIGAGPGRSADVTRSYAIAFEFAAAVSIAAAVATMARTPPAHRIFEQPFTGAHYKVK